MSHLGWKSSTDEKSSKVWIWIWEWSFCPYYAWMPPMGGTWRPCFSTYGRNCRAIIFAASNVPIVGFQTCWCRGNYYSLVGSETMSFFIFFYFCSRIKSLFHLNFCFFQYTLWSLPSSWSLNWLNWKLYCYILPYCYTAYLPGGNICYNCHCSPTILSLLATPCASYPSNDDLMRFTLSWYGL